MVTSVNTNINALAAVQALTDIGNQLTTTQAHIQSGLKVGSAADNPAVFTIAQGLRANIGALTAVSDSLATGTATVQAQLQGATSISNALTTLKQTITQGIGQSGDALAATNTQISNVLKNIDAYASASTINGVNLLKTSGSLATVSGIDGSTTVATTTVSSTSGGLGLTGLSIATGGVKLAGATGNAAANDTAVFTDGRGNTTTFTFVTSGTAASGTTTAGTLGTDGNSYNGTKTVQVVIGANSAESIGNLYSALQQNGVSASIDSAGAITFNGGGVKAADVTAAAAAGVATGAVATVTAAVVASATTVGTVTPLTTAASAASPIAAVDAAIATIGRTLSALGAAASQLQGFSDFTSKLSSSTTTSLGAIVDANLSEESAKLASLQTKQSLAIQSLSLANQGPGALLQLFR